MYKELLGTTQKGTILMAKILCASLLIFLWKTKLTLNSVHNYENDQTWNKL